MKLTQSKPSRDVSHQTGFLEAKPGLEDLQRGLHNFSGPPWSWPQCSFPLHRGKQKVWCPCELRSGPQNQLEEGPRPPRCPPSPATQDPRLGWQRPLTSPCGKTSCSQHFSFLGQKQAGSGSSVREEGSPMALGTPRWRGHNSTKVPSLLAKLRLGQSRMSLVPVEIYLIIFINVFLLSSEK